MPQGGQPGRMGKGKRRHSPFGADTRQAVEAGRTAAGWCHTEVSRKVTKDLMARSGGPAIRGTILLYGGMIGLACIGTGRICLASSVPAASACTKCASMAQSGCGWVAVSGMARIATLSRRRSTPGLLSGAQSRLKTMARISAPAPISRHPERVTSR